MTKKNLFCPNLSLPENKALVEKLGLFGFYREYIKNDFNIPQSVYEDVYDGTLSVEDMVYVNKDLFTGAQQDEIVDSILYQVQQQRINGISNVNTVKNNVRELFEETVEYFTESEMDEDTQELVNNLNSILEYYDEFFDKVNKKLAAQDITVDTNDTASFNNEESTYDSAENLNEKLNYSDDSNFQQSSKDTASANLKIALSLIPKYRYENGEIVTDAEGNYETIDSFIGSPTFESLDSIWTDLLFTLIDVPVGTKLDYLSNSENPKHRAIAEHIKSIPDTSIRNQFESVFSKQQAKFVTVSYSRPDKSGIKSIRVLDTNRLNADNLLIDFWYETFLTSPLLKDNQGIKTVDTVKGKELLNRYNKATAKLGNNDTINEDALKEIKDLLSEIGVDISMKALKSDGIYVNRTLETPVSIITNKLKYVFETVAGNRKPSIESEDTLELNNPYLDENSSLELLAKLENKVNPNVFEASFISGDGKAKYSFVNNTYASHKVRQLKTDVEYLNKLKGTSYASGSYYLNKLIEDASFRDVFQLEYVDSLGNDATNQTNKTFSNMNTKEKELTKVALYQNAGRGTSATESNIGQFIGLVPSDKSTTPIFRTLKVDVRSSEFADDNGNYRFNKAAYRVMMDQFMSEYNRVEQTLKEIEDPSVRKIAGYHTGDKMGAKFIVFPSMNTSLIKDGKLLALDDVRIRDIVKPKLQKLMSDLTKDQIAYWKELGIFPNTDNYKNFFDKSYANKIGINMVNPTQENLTKYGNAFAANYAVNQFIAMMNQTQLISGDPALHGKSIIRDLDPDTGSAYSKTWVNFYKRMAKDIAPGTDGNFGDNATYNTIFLKDLKYKSKHLDQYRELVGKTIGDNYEAMNPADAQEYTTLQEHLDVMKAFGRLNAEQEAAGKRLLEGGTSVEDIKLILQPMKPVYVNSQIEGSINVIYYIKSSSFPLIPGLTEGLEIDELRQFMEANNIQRSAYASAAKLGISGNLTEVSTDGGNVWSDNMDIDNTTVINLSRNGFRLQQEMPYHGDSSTINEGSQGRKLVLNNLIDSEVITFNGKQYTGREVKNIFENLHIEKMDRSLNQLTTDLGFDVETGKLTNISKIQDIIREEAESRNYPVNDLYSLQVIEENGKNTFKVPLSFTNNATRFESILNSMFTNRVIRNELPGFMGIQGASSGFQRVITSDQMQGSEFESGITWLNPSDTELNYIREENGTIQSADILVPNYIRNSSGDKINLQDYTLEDGTLDTSRIPEDVLTVIGQRIPTQGFNSMMKFKVKGFLPDIVGDLVIVPAEVVIQMGSDFDVDKLFIYNYHHKVNKDGTIKKITAELPDNATDIDYSKLSSSQIDNLIIQTFEDRLSDKNLMDQILTPNGFGMLPEVSEEVAKLTSKTKSVHTFSTREQNSISEINLSGKMGTAQFSLFSTFFKASQDAGLTISDPLLVKDSNGKTIELNSLSSLNNINGGKRSDVIMYLQSAAVDNAKEQILGNLNINDHTMGVAGTMAMLGYAEDFIGYFLSQPILREFSSLMGASNDIVSGTVDPSAKNRILTDLMSGLHSKNGRNPGDSNPDAEVALGVDDLISELSEETNLQTKVLSDFQTLMDLADSIQVLQSATNVDTKGLGATYGAIQAKDLQIDKVHGRIEGRGYPIINAEKLFEDNTVQKANEVLIKANNLLGQVYTYSSISYKNAIQEILSETAANPSEANLRDIYTNIKSFILSNPDLLNLEDINTTRDSLLYGKDNIAERWLKYSKSPEGRRNPLTKRITPKIAKNSEDFNGVKAINTPASNNSSDVNSSIMYFYDMLNSENSEEKRLAEDLVKFHVLTGAQYGPQSIGKYITYDVLEKYDFSKKLREIDRNLKTKQVLNNFIKQYFQNNPFKATTFDKSLVTKSTELPEVIFVDTNNNNLRNKDNQIVTYFTVYDTESNSPVLYERTDATINTLEYTKIPVLGNKYIKKYDFNSTVRGAITTPDREVLPVTSNAIVEALKEPTENTAQDLITERYGNNNSIREVLDNIRNKSNNPYYVKVASDLLNSGALNNVNLEFSEERLANGWYTNNTVYINPNAIASTKFNLTDKFEEVFLHELLHAGTVSSINNYDNLSDTGKKAVKKINRLFTEYSNSYENQEELARYKEINTRRLAGNKITSEERQFLVDNKTKLYHLVNVEEFIAAGLTNSEVSTELKSKNLWTRLMDLIADLLGINSNDLQFLYENTLEIIDSSQDSNRVQEDLFDSNDEYNRLEFVSQRDEFLRAHKTFIGKRITDNTLRKFQKSQQSKDKYNRLEIDSWNGELRIKRVDPIYEDINEGDESSIQTESIKDRTINSYLDRLKDSLARFNRRKVQMGDTVDPSLDAKIDNLQKRIKDLESERSISNFMTIAENKLNEISKNVDDYTDVDTLNDALTYTSVLKGINQTVQFSEEFEDWNNRINSISGKAVTLDKRIKRKANELLRENLRNNTGIDFNISESLNKGLKDVSWGEANFLDYSQSSSEHIQAIGYMIDRYQFNANQEHDSFNEEFIPLVEAYRAKYKNDYSQLLQLDDKGQPTGFLLNKYSQEYYNKARGNFKFFRENSNITISKESADTYEADKKYALDNLPMETYLEWEADNNPYEYIKSWKAGKRSTQKGAQRYVTITPKDKWIDSNYAKLRALPDNDPARQLYEFIEPILRRNNKRYGQQANYLPELQKTASDHLLEGKVKNAVNGLKEDLVDSFTDDLVVKQSEVDVVTGEPRLYIPKSMFGNTLEAHNKSLDLATITEKVVYQEINLKYKYQAEPILNLYYTILKDSRQFYKYNEQGVAETINTPPTRTIEHAQFLIQNYLYNKNRTDSETEAKYGKITDKAISYARVVGMGWNPFSAIGNITQGLTSNFTYSSDGRYFNKKEYTKATSLMMHVLAGKTDTSKKISAMFSKFDTFVKTNELNYGKSKELATATQSKLKSALEPYNMQQKGEYFIQGQTMVGILLNTKIETPSGEKISVFDGYDADGKWNPKYGEDPFADPDKLYKMTMKIRKAIIDVHGNYSRPIMAKKDFFARMAMIFRTWLPQAVNVRFGAETTDILLGTTTKGRYRTAFGGNFFKDKDGKFDFEATMENLKWLVGLSSNNSLSQVDQDNMRKNLTELAMILALTIAIAGLKAGLDDLDDEEKQYATYVLNTMSRASGDLTFFLIPSSANAIFQDPIPLMKTVQNTLDILPAGWNFIIGEDEYKTGSRKGRSKLGKELMDLVPLITQLDKNINYANMVMDDL